MLEARWISAGTAAFLSKNEIAVCYPERWGVWDLGIGIIVEGEV